MGAFEDVSVCMVVDEMESLGYEDACTGSFLLSVSIGGGVQK